MYQPKPIHTWLAIALVSAGLVVGSLVLTGWLDLHPCHLCIFQRLLFLLIAGLALVALVLTRPLARAVTGALVAVLAAVGLWAAIYQSWLQRQPPDAVSCIGGQPGLIERLVEWLGQQAPALFLATGFCEEEELAILGLSLANWAAVSFAAVLLAAAWALWLQRRPAR
ncbi:MAG: disulfide bond formation protein B [Chromatiaceae bacterium]|jgi:disulfide bond formation protein DsbB|nr:disulfide bond formation protein B [Chromatiaceae bacterium]